MVWVPTTNSNSRSLLVTKGMRHSIVHLNVWLIWLGGSPLLPRVSSSSTLVSTTLLDRTSRSIILLTILHELFSVGSNLCLIFWLFAFVHSMVIPPTVPACTKLSLRDMPFVGSAKIVIEAKSFVHEHDYFIQHSGMTPWSHISQF